MLGVLAIFSSLTISLSSTDATLSSTLPFATFAASTYSDDQTAPFSSRPAHHSAYRISHRRNSHRRHARPPYQSQSCCLQNADLLGRCPHLLLPVRFRRHDQLPCRP